MDKALRALVRSDTPKLNPLLANGIATEHMKEVEPYIDSVWRAIAKGFPDCLQYIRGERCSAQEEFDKLTKRRQGNKQVFDVARTNIFMMKYLFRFTDPEGKSHEFKHYLSLPFVEDAGVTYISGSRFSISPILADRVISVGLTNIFVRFNRAMATFERMPVHFIADGQRETVQVAWSMIYNKSDKMKKLKPVIKASTTLVHYLFCKYGFSKVMNDFAKCQPKLMLSDEYNPADYPDEDWVLCRSAYFGTNQKPRTFKPAYYQPTKLIMAIPRSQYTQEVKNYVAGFFYIADHFPDRIKPTTDYFDNTWLWKVLMGELLFGSNISLGRLADDTSEHIYSLDEYIDAVIKPKFADIGMPIEDIYQLFGIIIDHFNDWLLAGASKINSMYEKELSVLYYVLLDISNAINRFYFKLKVAAKKGKLTEKEIVNMMTSTVRLGEIYKINRLHGEVSTFSSSGDNKATKITSILVPQANSSKTGGKNKDNTLLKDPTKHLHVSVAEVGGAFNLPKAEPSGRSRLNPHALVDSKNVILRNPELFELLESVEEQISR